MNFVAVVLFARNILQVMHIHHKESCCSQCRLVLLLVLVAMLVVVILTILVKCSNSMTGRTIIEGLKIVIIILLRTVTVMAITRKGVSKGNSNNKEKSLTFEKTLYSMYISEMIRDQLVLNESMSDSLMKSLVVTWFVFSELARSYLNYYFTGLIQLTDVAVECSSRSAVSRDYHLLRSLL